MRYERNKERNKVREGGTKRGREEERGDNDNSELVSG